MVEMAMPFETNAKEAKNAIFEHYFIHGCIQMNTRELVPRAMV